MRSVYIDIGLKKSTIFEKPIMLVSTVINFVIGFGQLYLLVNCVAIV